MNWVVLTGSYPPDEGGIADYTFVVANHLAQLGDRVWIFTGPGVDPGQPSPIDGVTLKRLPTHFTPSSLVALESAIAALPQPREILVQYVPQAFGPRAHSRFYGLPLWFCFWLKWRKPAKVSVMLHETIVNAAPGAPPLQRLLHHLTRWMLAWLCQAADRLFLSTEAWRAQVAPWVRPGAPVVVLPVPSNVAVSYDAAQADSIHGPVGLLLGHFGTFREPQVGLIRQLIPHLLTSNRRMLLIGSGGDLFLKDLLIANPALATRVAATGALPGEAIAAHIGACDLMIQPYPDGVTSRRGTLMAAIALAKPVVTNDGDLTEPLWRDSGAVAIVPRFDPELYAAKVDELATPGKLAALGLAGRDFYRRHCSIERTVAALKS